MIMEGGWKPNVEISPSCPRCGSSNTKFCYYNNYSLTQPRYLCKGCRRYWTKGGSLRNVPVGGGCRKNRRGKSLRLSSDAGVSTKNMAYGIASTTIVAGSYGISSSVANDGSHIDLPRVYANYLNQQVDSGNKYEDQDFSSDQSDAHQLLSNIIKVDESIVHLIEPSSFLEYEAMTENFGEAHLNNNNQVYCSEIESFPGPHDGTQQYGSGEISYATLPKLPSEDDVVSQDMPWSNPSLVGHDSLQAPDLALLGGPESQDPTVFVSKWKEFDLSDDSFPGK